MKSPMCLLGIHVSKSAVYCAAGLSTFLISGSYQCGSNCWIQLRDSEVGTDRDVDRHEAVTRRPRIVGDPMSQVRFDICALSRSKMHLVTTEELEALARAGCSTPLDRGMERVVTLPRLSGVEIKSGKLAEAAVAGRLRL